MLNRHPDDAPLFKTDQPADETWVLLWSHRQRGLHIEKVGWMLQSHVEAFREDRELVYIPLAFGPRKAIDCLAEKLRPTVARRSRTQLAPAPDGHVYERFP